MRLFPFNLFFMKLGIISKFAFHTTNMNSDLYCKTPKSIINEKHHKWTFLLILFPLNSLHLYWSRDTIGSEQQEIKLIQVSDLLYTTIQNFFIWKKLMLLFSKDTTNWSKVTVKTFIMLEKIYISNKCYSFELLLIKESLKKLYFHKNIYNMTPL